MWFWVGLFLRGLATAGCNAPLPAAHFVGGHCNKRLQ